jgi:hypothetical protein
MNHHTPLPRVSPGEILDVAGSPAKYGDQAALSKGSSMTCVRTPTAKSMRMLK